MPAAPGAGGKFRILVVEDDPSIARLVLANLTKAGMECRYAPDGTTGLTAFREAKPHLVLTDIMMPGLNGAELCAKIRELSKVPIIMMTAADSEDRQMEGFKVGADDYVAKPFNPKLMVARVIAHLRRVYDWDVPKPAEKPDGSGADIPLGWVSCDTCGYLDAVEKFEHKDARGRSFMICPLCQGNANFTFPIG